MYMIILLVYMLLMKFVQMTVIIFIFKSSVQIGFIFVYFCLYNVYDYLSCWLSYIKLGLFNSLPTCVIC